VREEYVIGILLLLFFLIKKVAKKSSRFEGEIHSTRNFPQANRHPELTLRQGL